MIPYLTASSGGTPLLIIKPVRRAAADAGRL